MALVLLCMASLLLALPSLSMASPTRTTATTSARHEADVLREASACYGTVDTDLELECPEGEVINVTEIFHGAKPRSLNCTTPEYRKNFDRSCCRRQSRDCMLPVVGEMRRSLVAQCSGLTSCVTRTTWTNTNGHCDSDTYLPQTNYMYISYACHSGQTAKPTEREEVLVEPRKPHISSTSDRPSSSTTFPTTTSPSPTPTPTTTATTTPTTTATTTPTTTATTTPTTTATTSSSTTDKTKPTTKPSTPVTTTVPPTTTQLPTSPAPPSTIRKTTPPVSTPSETLFMPDDLPVRPADPPTTHRTTAPGRLWPSRPTSGNRPWDSWNEEATATALPPLILDFDVDRWTEGPPRDVTSGGPASRSQRPMGVVQDSQEFAFTTGMLGGMTAAVLGMLFTIIAFLLYCGRKRRRHVMAKPQSSVWDFLLAHTITVRNFRRGYDNFSSTRTSISSEGEPPSPVHPPRSGWRPNITVGPAPSESNTSDDNVSLTEPQHPTNRSPPSVAAAPTNQQATRAQQEQDTQLEHSA